jgi:hypothetical protein
MVMVMLVHMLFVPSNTENMELYFEHDVTQGQKLT